MGVTNSQSGTRVDEIADGIYRITTPVTKVPGGFSFNQYLVVDEQPLLYHTGPRGMLPLVRAAIDSVMPFEKLRWVGFSHFENDECGSINDILAIAKEAQPLCGRINGLINGDYFDRPAHVLEEGGELSLGRHRLRWIDTPHLPHAWECGHLFDATTRTLFCGDLFTQGGSTHAPLTTSDILGPSEAFRKPLDYYSHTKSIFALMEKLAVTAPTTLACMHGSALQGDGAGLLRELAATLARD